MHRPFHQAQQCCRMPHPTCVIPWLASSHEPLRLNEAGARILPKACLQDLGFCSPLTAFRACCCRLGCWSIPGVGVYLAMSRLDGTLPLKLNGFVIKPGLMFCSGLGTTTYQIRVFYSLCCRGFNCLTAWSARAFLNGAQACLLSRKNPRTNFQISAIAAISHRWLLFKWKQAKGLGARSVAMIKGYRETFRCDTAVGFYIGRLNNLACSTQAGCAWV